jgi:hypothetical protein
MTDVGNVWELPLNLGDCRPNIAAPEKQSRLSAADKHAPLPPVRASGASPFSISLEQQQSLNAAISMRLAELHKSLIADHERILTAKGSAAVQGSSFCSPTLNTRSHAITAAEPINPSVRLDNRALPRTSQASAVSAGSSRYPAMHGSSPNVRHQEADAVESAAKRQGQVEAKDSEQPAVRTSQRQTALFDFSNTEAIKERFGKLSSSRILIVFMISTIHKVFFNRSPGIISSKILHSVLSLLMLFGYPSIQMETLRSPL